MIFAILAAVCIVASHSAQIQKRAAGACYYNGQSYQQGQTWTVPCQYNCECKDASRGYYQCTEMCPNYPNLPKECQLVKKQGECCSKPECNFQTSAGQVTGSASGSGGTGTGSGTGTGTVTCNDRINNCDAYGTAVCNNAVYDGWVRENCPKSCNKCPSTSGTGGTITIGGGTGTGSTGTGTGTGGTGTGTGTGTGGTSTGGSGQCRDNLSNCDAYGQPMCTQSKYNDWVNANCAAYCHRSCNSGGTVTGTGGGTITGGGTGTGTGGSTGTGTGTITGGGTGTGTGTGGGTVTGGGTGTVTGGGSVTCQDKNPGCGRYVAAMCTDAQYRPWARENCAAHCNFCGTGSTGTGTGSTGTGTGSTGTGTGSGSSGTGNCVDKVNNCAQLNSANRLCSDAGARIYAQLNCARTCNLCSSTGTGTGTGGTITGGGTGTGTGTGAHTNTGGISSQTGTISGTSSGCVYKGQVYTQGQEFRDGCDFKCSCEDASQGRYRCRSMCVTWNLPSICSLNPPARGKCCKTPSCPSNVQITYPPGYVEE